MIRRHRRRTTDAPFDHGEPIKGINTLPFAILATACVAFFIPFQKIPTHAVVVDLPVPSDQMPAWDKVPIVNRITIDSESYLRWNGTQISGAGLATLLRKSKKLNPEPYLLFEPDGEASYDVAARVLNIIAATGLAGPNFCMVGLSHYRHFGKDSSGVNPTITTTAQQTKRLNLSIIFDDEQRHSDQMITTSALSPAETECEALTQIP